MDRPDDDRAGRLLPDAAPTPPRSGWPTTRASFPIVEVDATYYALPARADGRAVGRADAARLHLRRQGARADDRPADRDQATAEGHPRGAPRRARRARPAIYAKDLPAELRDEVWRASPTGSSRSREAGQLGLDPAPVPALVLPSSREPRRDPRGARAACARRACCGGRVPQRVLVQREEPRADAALPRGQRDPARHGRRAAGLQEQRAADRRGDLARTWRSSASTAAATATWEATGIPTVERFRYLYDRGRAGRVGAAHPRGGRSRRATCTS